jgi:DNA replication protein DnaC
LNASTKRLKITLPCPVRNERYKDACLSKIDFLSIDQMAQLNDWMKNPKKFLYIRSSYGVGKNYLASAIALYYYNLNFHVYFFEEHELFTMLEEEVCDGRKAYGKIDTICENHMVCWNDFGSTIGGTKNNFNDTAKFELMHQFVDTRYNSMMPTIITSNLTYDDFCYTISERTADRLFATENLILEISGPNKRREGL